MKWLVILALVPCLLTLASGQERQNLLKLVSDFAEIKDVDVKQLWGAAPELNIKITLKKEDCPVTACPAPQADPQENSCKTNPIRDCSCFNVTSHPYGFNADIQPLLNGLKFKAFCNVQGNTIWTRILERMYGNRAEMDAEGGFNRDFAQYRTGFGKLSGNNFMGLDKINALTQAADMQLMVKFYDYNWSDKDGRFTTFKVAGPEDNFRLSLAGESGDLGSALMSGNGQPFSAKDKDNGGQGCPATRLAGWWYPAANCDTSCTMTAPWENVMCNGMKSKVVSFYVAPK